MQPNIVHIDLSILDSEIKELQNMLSVKIEIRNSISKYVVNGKSVKETPFRIDSLGAIQDDSIPVSKTETGKNIGISEFIIGFIKEMGITDSRDVIRAYAALRELPDHTVRNNVSNAIVRLKQSGKIESRPKEDGRGNELYIKEKAPVEELDDMFK